MPSSASKEMPPAVEMARAIGWWPVIARAMDLRRSGGVPVSAQEIGLHRRKAGGFAQVIGARVLALRAGETRLAICCCERVGAEIDIEGDRVRGREGFAQHGRQRVDRTAFDAVARDHGIAARGVPAETERDVLERLAGEAGCGRVRSSRR